MRYAPVESVAVGFFDGVHVGHQAILRCVGRALTFRSHPLSVLAPERAPRLIMSPGEKVAAIRACGVRDVEMVDFTAELAAMPPEEFSARFLRRGGSGRPPAVVCGENWRFGAEGRGDADFLRSHGYEVTVVPYAMVGGERVSSSRIRRSLAAGEVSDAASMLGRPVAVQGTRFPGKGVGMKIGFPTVNVMPESPVASLLPLGVYAAAAAGARAVVNYGVAPTMGAAAWREPVLEMHFVDAPPPDAMPERITVELHAFLRPEKEFPSVESLRRQVSDDVRRCMDLTNMVKYPQTPSG